MNIDDEIHSQVDQGKAALLLYKDEAGENVKVVIRKPTEGQYQGQYTRRATYPDLPNPFPTPQTVPFNTWTALLSALFPSELTSDQWQIE